ncbi:MAG TPA: c-type cytochrome [Myxococcales bacterium]|nr:c-type cytochrome [Myxococcales bacterium]
MRSAALLLAAVLAPGCFQRATITQPPPPPLAVPPENAAGPASVRVDAGTPDAGVEAPDAGAPRADLASPITAAGTETPLGLGWGEKGEQPASALFQNVKLMGALSGNRFMAAMQSMRANLGAKCGSCHLAAEKDFASDAKEEKRRAREMIRMNEEINRRTFGGKVRVTCWTCHRGDEEPAKMSFSKELPEPFEKMPPERLAAKAEAAFKDVRVLKGMDVRNFGLLMGWFAREMGGKCTHCHQEQDFAADTPRKTRAREMLEMTSYIASGYFGNDSPVGCDTCHRGSPAPPRTPGDKS